MKPGFTKTPLRLVLCAVLSGALAACITTLTKYSEPPPGQRVLDRPPPRDDKRVAMVEAELRSAFERFPALLGAPEPRWRKMKSKSSSKDSTSETLYLLTKKTPFGFLINEIKEGKSKYGKTLWDFLTYRYLGGIIKTNIIIYKHDFESHEKKTTRLENFKINGVTGKLFPLKIGNELSVDETYSQRTGDGSLEVTNQHIKYFVSKEILGSRCQITPSIEGKLFVISYEGRIDTRDGNPYTYASEMHYSEDLGMLVFCQAGASNSYEAEPAAVAAMAEAKVREEEDRRMAAARRLTEQKKPKLDAQARKTAASARSKSGSHGGGARKKAQGLFGQAFALYQEGSFKAAAVKFRQGLAIDGTDPQANFYLAETLRELKDHVNAYLHYRISMLLGPGSDIAGKAADRLASLGRN